MLSLIGAHAVVAILVESSAASTRGSSRVICDAGSAKNRGTTMTPTAGSVRSNGAAAKSLGALIGPIVISGLFAWGATVRLRDPSAD